MLERVCSLFSVVNNVFVPSIQEAVYSLLFESCLFTSFLSHQPHRNFFLEIFTDFNIDRTSAGRIAVPYFVFSSLEVQGALPLDSRFSGFDLTANDSARKSSE
jgi:hypothetical protein